ncbi:hypothetical protein TKK_0013696 [Trichogramma kaykai]|uniref:Reverse transcriptase/retrotransposon-derived protein RNase H-like domain-containing protein n=1 Tax=Trichogramma kaykai TaxID=54128 RepID=A0ABD2WH28_9HYME
MLVQDLWRARLDWDEELPSSMARRWLDLRQSFESVSSMSVPRWIGLTSDVADLTIHVFADASRRAMAAVAYSRVDRGSQEAVVRLLVAKTKLSPIRS